MSYHYHYKILYSKVRPWRGAMGQKLYYTHFKVVWQSSFKYSYLSNHWQELSHTWNIIALTFITKHYIQGSDRGVGIRGQELGHIHFEVWRQSVFKHISALNGKNPSILGTQSYQSIALHFYSILFCSMTLEGRQGTTAEFATIFFHLVLFSAALVELAKVGRKTLRNWLN